MSQPGAAGRGLPPLLLRLRAPLQAGRGFVCVLGFSGFVAYRKSAAVPAAPPQAMRRCLHAFSPHAVGASPLHPAPSWPLPPRRTPNPAPPHPAPPTSTRTLWPRPPHAAACCTRQHCSSCAPTGCWRTCLSMTRPSCRHGCVHAFAAGRCCDCLPGAATVRPAAGQRVCHARGPGFRVYVAVLLRAGQQGECLPGSGCSAADVPAAGS